MTEAQEALADKARSLVNIAYKASKIAGKKGDAGPALELLKHIAVVGEDGKEVRPLMPSVDKPAAQIGDGGGGPRVLIGFNFSGAPQPALPPAVTVEAAAIEPAETAAVDADATGTPPRRSTESPK